MCRAGHNNMADVAVKSCYYKSCQSAPKWAVRTKTSVLPDGSPFDLFACDEHCEELTEDCRRAGARYLLRPIGGGEPPPKEPAPADESPEKAFAGYPLGIRILGTIVAVALVMIAPFVIGYYVFKASFFGWRPPRDGS